MVYNHDLLVNLDAAVVNLTNSDTSNKFIVINGRYKHLCVCLRVTLWGRNVVDDTVKERLHIFLFVIKISNSIS